MQLLINLIIIFVLLNMSLAHPHHEFNNRQMDKLSYVLTDSISELEEKNESINGLSIKDNSNNENQESNKIKSIRQSIQSVRSPANHYQHQSESTGNKYSNLVTKIVKQIISKRTKNNVVNEYRRRKNIEQIEKRNDLIKNSIDRKFKLLSELTLKRLKPAFEFELPDMTPEEHDELVNDINKLINEDGSFRRRDVKS